MTTYKELFENLGKEIQSASEAPHASIDLNIYRRTAEQIALNGKSSVILMCIFIATAFAITAFIQEVRISNRNHIIQEQRNVLSAQGIQDSIIFNCTHCGWKHTLELEPNAPHP